jgi:hypothetical protein
MADPASYTTDIWNGIPHYVCLACGYDTMLEPRITEHCASCPAGAALPQAPLETAASLSHPPDSTASTSTTASTATTATTAPTPEPPMPPPPEPVPVPAPDDPDGDEDDENAEETPM